MSVSAEINVVGVKDALRELNTIDKRLRRQITKDYQEIVQPIVTDAKALVPEKAPISGFDRKWTPQGSSKPVLPFGASGTDGPARPRKDWAQSKGGRKEMGDWNKWKAGIRAYISGKRPQTFGGYTRNLSAFGVRWQSRAAILFDTSAQSRTPQGAQMVQALTEKFGPPSRVMWKAYDASDTEVQYRLRKLVEKIMASVGRDLK